jgi:hypothetical protein
MQVMFRKKEKFIEIRQSMKQPKTKIYWQFQNRIDLGLGTLFVQEANPV